MYVYQHCDCLGRLRESATYPDEQRRPGLVGKHSICGHIVSCMVECLNGCKKKKRQSYGASWRDATSIRYIVLLSV